MFIPLQTFYLWDCIYELLLHIIRTLIFFDVATKGNCRQQGDRPKGYSQKTLCSVRCMHYLWTVLVRTALSLKSVLLQAFYHFTKFHLMHQQLLRLISSGLERPVVLMQMCFKRTCGNWRRYVFCISLCLWRAHGYKLSVMTALMHVFYTLMVCSIVYSSLGCYRNTISTDLIE